jgi:hypothetical protein
MREIAAVLGLPDKPMEVDVPKNLVSLLCTAPDNYICILAPRT